MSAQVKRVDEVVPERKTMMTVEEVAERWGVNTRTIYAAIAKGQVKAMRVGRLVRISRSHVEFLEDGQRK